MQTIKKAFFCVYFFIPFFVVAQSNQDKQIWESFLQLYEKQKPITNPDLLVKIGMGFMDTPYVAHTLDRNDSERLVVNLKEVDCTTFVEYCLAMTYALQTYPNPSYEDFTNTLQAIRYKNGEIVGYASRNHYMTSWIANNTKYLSNISENIGGINSPKKINFMTNHVFAYPMLSKDTSQIKYIKDMEAEISDTNRYTFIPQAKISTALPLLQNGDIVIFATSIAELDYSHIGIVVKENDQTKLLHASSKYKKVLVDPKSLLEYCQANKSCTGITILRLK